MLDGDDNKTCLGSSEYQIGKVKKQSRHILKALKIGSEHCEQGDEIS